MKLAIDAGHGFGNATKGKYDSGAPGPHGVDEADITLQWALTGKFICGKLGVDCFLTRDDDTDVTPVGSRDDFSRQAGCTHFISIHCNSSGNETAHGIEAYYRVESGKKLALQAVQSCQLATGSNIRGVFSEGNSQHSRLAVLNFGQNACLLEIGFISNPKEYMTMLNRDVRITFWKNFLAKLRGAN